MSDAVDAHALALTFGQGRIPGQISGAALESAIGRPYTGYYRRVWSKAAALLESLVRNHPFVDGNKRTALILVHLFLLRSGYGFARTTGSREVEDMIVAVAAGKAAFAEIEDWFRDRVVKLTR